MHHLVSSTRVRIAALLCAGGMALLGWTTRAALDPRMRFTAPARPITPASRVATPLDSVSDDIVDKAIDRDPFSAPHQTPGESAIVAVHAEPAAEVPRLVGTVVDAADQSFVVCQLGAGGPRVVRVGQQIGTYRLESVSQGSAVFATSEGQRLELRVPKTGA